MFWLLTLCILYTLQLFLRICCFLFTISYSIFHYTEVLHLYMVKLLSFAFVISAFCCCCLVWFLDEIKLVSVLFLMINCCTCVINSL